MTDAESNSQRLASSFSFAVMFPNEDEHIGQRVYYFIRVKRQAKRPIKVGFLPQASCIWQRLPMRPELIWITRNYIQRC